MYYKEADGGTVSFELAGDQEIDSNETEFVSRYVDFEDEGTVPAGFDYDTKDSRLARMQFKFVDIVKIWSYTLAILDKMRVYQYQ